MQAHDDLIIEQIRREKGAASSLNVIGLSTKSEPLLWIPDIIAWAFRQQYLKDGGGYFSELAKSAKVIHI
jgi:hypothetical protein